MERRFSCRNFSKQRIDEVTFEALENACRQLTETPFGHPVEFGIQELGAGGRVKLGTYGTVTDPYAFIYGYAAADPMVNAGYGYLFEQLILLATSLGLATCWLGFFRRRGLLKALNPPPGCTIPAVSPIGYPSGKLSIYGAMARSISAGRRRKAPSELFFLESFQQPFEHLEDGIVGTALKMVRIAPSAGNLQPWRLLIQEGGATIHFFADLGEPYGGLIRKSLKWLDIGIAMCHLDLAMRERGVVGRWVRLDQVPYSGSETIAYVATWIEP